MKCCSESSTSSEVKRLHVLSFSLDAMVEHREAHRWLSSRQSLGVDLSANASSLTKIWRRLACHEPTVRRVGLAGKRNECRRMGNDCPLHGAPWPRRQLSQISCIFKARTPVLDSVSKRPHGQNGHCVKTATRSKRPQGASKRPQGASKRPHEESKCVSVQFTWITFFNQSTIIQNNYMYDKFVWIIFFNQSTILQKKYMYV